MVPTCHCMGRHSRVTYSYSQFDGVQTSLYLTNHKSHEVGQVSHARIHFFGHFLFLFHHAANTGSWWRKSISHAAQHMPGFFMQCVCTAKKMIHVSLLYKIYMLNVYKWNYFIKNSAVQYVMTKDFIFSGVNFWSSCCIPFVIVKILKIIFWFYIF